MPGVQGCLHKLDAQPAAPGGEEGGRDQEDYRRSSWVRKHVQIVFILSVDHSQPNDQGRVVAPITSLSDIRNIASKDDARLLLIVRHPFDRLVKIIPQYSNLIILFIQVGVCLS